MTRISVTPSTSSKPAAVDSDPVRAPVSDRPDTTVVAVLAVVATAAVTLIVVLAWAPLAAATTSV